MERWEIDINCDVGEGLGNEAKLFPYISSCNLACGGHAGDAKTMSEVISLAMSHNIRIGAHPSYPDKDNFGRKSINMEAGEFKKSILSQVRMLEDLIAEQKGIMTHIKAHGALYNDLATDRELSILYLDTLREYRSSVSLFVPYGSVIGREAEKSGFKFLYEAFGDRNYRDDLTLVPRSEGNALLTNPTAVFEHLIRMIQSSSVRTISGALIPLVAHTYCIHGDTRSAYEILMYLSDEFPKHNIHLKK